MPNDEGPDGFSGLPCRRAGPASAPKVPAASLTTVDAFLGGAIEIEQPARGYRAGLDAVLLAAAATPIRPKRGAISVIDVGAGVGTAGLCLAARLGSADVTLVEQDPLAGRLAERNILRNDLTARARVAMVDVLKPASLGKTRLPPDASFDLSISNPPYLVDGRLRRSDDAFKAASHAMPEEGLDRWLRFMARMTQPGGTALIVHRADCLHALLAAMASRFGDVTVLPLHPRRGEPASRVIVRAIKGSRAPLRLAHGLALHDDDGSFRPDIKAVLTAPRGLKWPRR